MNNKQANRKPSDAPKYVTNNTRSRGNTLMELPEAALLVGLLEPTNPQARTLNADETLNYNVTYLALGHRSQTRRKKLFTNISKLLGNKMDDWHEALHRPRGLPANALDWSTVLLQQTLDLAKSVPGNVLSGVHQAMTAKISGLVKAALLLRTAEPTSAKSIEICQLRATVQSLQETMDDETDLVMATQGLETHNLQDDSAGEQKAKDGAEAHGESLLSHKFHMMEQLHEHEFDAHILATFELDRIRDKLEDAKEKLRIGLSRIGELTGDAVEEDVEDANEETTEHASVDADLPDHFGWCFSSRCAWDTCGGRCKPKIPTPSIAKAPE
jgi:hypothetical protein